MDVITVPLYSLNVVVIDAGSIFQHPKQLPHGFFVLIQHPILLLSFFGFYHLSSDREPCDSLASADLRLSSSSSSSFF